MEAVQQTTPRLVRMKDAAAQLGIARTTLLRMVAAGRLEKVVISARASRITAESIERFIAESRATSEAIS